MNTWIFVFAACLVCPIMLLIFGVRFLKFQPKLNGICGLRIKSALKNEETWDFAHQYGGKLWRNMGLIMALLVIVIMVVLYPFSELIIAFSGVLVVLAEFIAFISSFYFVRRRLTKKFGEK
ncbi:MAG: SdpI family protein [Clostridia bacterium]|nr:SdpI family protein [Clostridia bacterium]